MSCLRRSSVAFRPILASLLVWMTASLAAQTDTHERIFPQSKAAIEAALNSMRANLSGRLPVLDGFATTEHPFDRYQRGFYQAAVDVSQVSGGSRVRINAKVTAWYSDPSGAHSGYQLVTSNGRLEADLLDQLAEQIAKAAPDPSPERKKANQAAELRHPDAPTPVDRKSELSALANRGFSSSRSESVAARESGAASPDGATAAKPNDSLQKEVDSLEEVLKNQGHPKNLVAIKKSGTPVVATPSLSAKPLFLASRHDEFEMLDFNEDWVHVRVSGLSRGWIWRNSLEMPEGIPDTAPRSGPSPSPAADLFHVIREETAQFPGDWQPLRGKSVKIISVQKVDDTSKDRGLQDKLEYAKYLLEKNLADVTRKPQDLAGIVLIFDSSDGGMIAATVATLQQWKSGALSDSALWHSCFFDPPETFDSSPPSGSQ